MGMSVLYTRCAGLDVHRETVVACLMLTASSGKTTREVRTFATTTLGLQNMADWLARHEVSHVGMESTGIYWRPVFNILEGQYVEAESLLKLALSLRKQHLSADDLAIATSLSNLAGLYFYQDSYRQAAPLVKSAFAIRQQRLGAEHSETIESLKHLAILLLRQEQYEQSELFHRRVLSIRQQCLGEKHLDTAESLQGLADLYREWARYEEAAPFYVQVLAIREKILGWESPSILKARQTYAAMLQIMMPAEQSELIA